MNAASETHKEALLENLKAVISHSEELLRMGYGEGEEKGQELRERMQERIRQAKTDLGRLQESALTNVRAAGQATDTFVHDNPWQSTGIAVGVGLLLGLLLARR